MNKLPILCVLAAVAAFPQAQTPLTITQSAGSATGELRMQERRTNGTNYVGIKAPQSVATNTVWTLPSADGTSGQCLTTDGAGQWQWEACSDTRLVSDYDWTQVMGARSGSGAITLTFTGTSCPAAGADAAYVFRVYETSTPTTYELATSNATGTCTRGGAGTIVATGPTGTYTNATATSASSGWQEAVFSVADSLPVYLRAAVGGYYVYSDILTEDRYLTVECDGPGALLVPMANNVSVFNAASPGGIRVSHCGFNNVYAKTGTKAVYTYNPDGDSFGTLLYDNNISGFEKCVHLESVYGLTGYAYNRHIDCTDTALHLENPNTGDAGIGLVGPGNIFSDSVPGGANYGILWNGPGNLKVIGNSFNGYLKQIYGRLKMGVADVSGTAVTWQSGHKFRPSYFTPTPGNFVCGSTVASTIAGYTDDENLTLTTGPASPVNDCDYYINNTGQLLIQNNTFDSWTWTTNDVELAGDILYLNWQIQNNFSSNPNQTTFDASYKVSGANWYFGSIKGNNCQTSYVIGTCVELDGGSYIDVSDNQVVNLVTGTAIGAGASYVMTDGNRCANSNTTDCVTSAASTSILREVTPVTYTQLVALSAANSSSLYCSNCKQTSASSATCATGGSGARATRINGAWKCDDGSVANAFVQGGNSFGATAELGTADAYGVQFKTNNTGIWAFQTTGHLWASSNNVYDIGAGISSNSPRNIYAATSMVAPAFSAIDSSGSYVAARKLEVHMDGTGTAFFNWSFGTSNTMDLLDTASGVIQRWDRNTSDVSFDANVWPRGTTETRNLGLTTARWLALNTKNLNLSGNVTSNLTPSGTRDLGATGSEWNGLYAGTAVVTSIIEPKVNGGAQNGDSTKRWSTTYTQDLNASGTITFPTGTTGYVWTNAGSGVGGWAAAGACSTCIINGGNTTGATLTIGTNDAQTLSLETNNISYLQISSTGVTTIAGNVIPSGTRSLGITGTEWDSIYAGSGVITSIIEPKVNGGAQNGDTLKRWSNVYTVDLNVSGTCTGCSSLPVVDTTGIAKGSADATKIVRLEVDGLTTGTTRVMTVPDVNMTLAGRDVANTFTAAQTYNSTVSYASTISSGLSPTTTLAYDQGSASLQWATIYTGNITASLTGTFGTLVVNSRTLTPQAANYTLAGTNLSQTFSNTQTFSGTLAVSGTVGDDFIPNSDGTYVNGTTSFRWGSIATYNADFNGVLTFSGGTTFTGSFLPTTNNLYSIGNTSFRLSTVVTTNFNVSGTITAPSGSSGLSATKTVRDSAGTGTCTLIFSGGILTGGTC